MPLSHHVAVITSDEQALVVASDLADDFKRDSALRDRERRLPHPELEVFSRSGLWGISVPKEYGGAGVSNVTLAKVIALIAQADGSLGQIPQNHFYALEVLRVNGSEEQKNACTQKYWPASASAMRSPNWAPKPPTTASLASPERATAIASTVASSTPPAQSMPSASPPRWWMSMGCSNWRSCRATAKA